MVGVQIQHMRQQKHHVHIIVYEDVKLAGISLCTLACMLYILLTAATQDSHYGRPLYFYKESNKI